MNPPVAWLVVDAQGHRSVFLDRAAAERYAARVCGGVLHPLFTGTRKDDPQ